MNGSGQNRCASFNEPPSRNRYVNWEVNRPGLAKFDLICVVIEAGNELLVFWYASGTRYARMYESRLGSWRRGLKELSLEQAVKAHRVVRRRGSHIF
jgi:hypothetical protein